MSGATFMLHGCGIVGSYIAMSHEKYLLDEEIIGMLRRMLLPIDVTDERIDMDTIKQVGCGGEYLTNPQTFKYCRSEFFMPDLAQRLDYSSWMNKGSRDIKDIAKEKLEERLNQWEKPAIDSDIEARLADYVQTHTAS